MSKARPRTTRLRLITAALGIVALVVFGSVTHWNPVAWYHAWRIGYYIHWTPDGVVPSYSRSNHLAPGGLVAVEIHGGNPDPRAAIWDSKSGELELIDPLPETDGRSRTGSIGSYGLAIGTAYSGTNHLARGWLWSRSSGLVELGTLGGSQIAPIDVNDSGDVVGWAATAKGRHAFLWTSEDGIQDLGVQGYAAALNESRCVVGTIEASGAQISREPFVWSPEDGMRRIGLAKGFSLGGAIDVNERGEVLVNFNEPVPMGGGRTRYSATAFIWTEAVGLRPLPLPPGDIDVRAAVLNDRGDVLLSAGDANEPAKAYLIHRGELMELPAITEADGTHYEAMDNHGWLLGRARFDGEWRGFVAEPFR